jgi:hypothetical protein
VSNLTSDRGLVKVPRHLAGARAGQNPLPRQQVFWYHGPQVQQRWAFERELTGYAERGERRIMLGFGLLLLLLVGGAVAPGLGGAERLRGQARFVHPRRWIDVPRASCWTSVWHGERSIETSTRRFAPGLRASRGGGR